MLTPYTPAPVSTVPLLHANRCSRLKAAYGAHTTSKSAQLGLVPLDMLHQHHTSDDDSVKARGRGAAELLCCCDGRQAYALC